MKIIRNEKLIKRYNRLGGGISIVAVLVLAGGMYITFKEPQLVSYAFIALFLGYAFMQIGMYLGNRYGRSPRADEKLDTSLKGLPGDYSIYHFAAPASHLLVGPAGLWVLLPYHQHGKITYQKNRWRLSGGGFGQAYMRIFGQDNIGRPDIDAENEIRSMRNFLAKNMDENEIPEINAALVFSDEGVEINAQDAPMPAMKFKQLKDFIRQKAKEKRIPPGQFKQIAELLENT